jgi:hypothetical protein
MFLNPRMKISVQGSLVNIIFLSTLYYSCVISFYVIVACVSFAVFFTWQVKSRPLAKTLNKTSVVSGEIMGRTILLTLGRSKVEWDRTNCGIFLYWHGRLIEVRLAVLA